MNVKLYNDDCLNVLKEIEDNSVDFILTDPPYNIARDNNFHTMGRKGIDFGEWFEVKKFKQTLHGEVISFIRPILLKLD